MSRHGRSFELCRPPPRDHALGPRPHVGRCQAGGKRLVAGCARIRRDAMRHAVIGRAVDDRLVGANGIEIQDGGRAREDEKRPGAGAAPAKSGDQGLLRGLVQSLLQHVDDQDRRAFRFQPDQQRDQGIRRPGAILDEPREGAIDARLEVRVGVEKRPRWRAAIRQPLEAEERRIRQGLGQPLRQSRLAAAQRTGDVVQRTDVAAARTARRPTAREGRRRRWSSGAGPSIRAKSPAVGGWPRPRSPRSARTFSTVTAEIAQAAFQHRLVSRQSRLQNL